MWRRSASELSFIKGCRGRSGGLRIFLTGIIWRAEPWGDCLHVERSKLVIHGEYLGLAGKEWDPRVSGHKHEWIYSYSEQCGRMSEVNRDMWLCASTLCAGGVQVSWGTGGFEFALFVVSERVLWEGLRGCGPDAYFWREQCIFALGRCSQILTKSVVQKC